MSHATRPVVRNRARGCQEGHLPALEPGDHLDQRTFHQRYQAAAENIKAELIGGVVYMPSVALKRPHGRSHSLLIRWLGAYEDATAGVEVYDNATTVMADDSEPQPDACLIIHPDKGGQMRFTDDDYLEGAAEFVGEVAASTESYDLHSKKRDYERAGVREYLVVALRQKKVIWFVNRSGAFDEVSPDEDGLYRSQVFPGLWLDPQALLEFNGRALLATVQQGLATLQHAAFAQRLAHRS